ncbi:MAG: hypothetical protein ACT4QF_23360 [Sporichthyaceae bacterium]
MAGGSFLQQFDAQKAITVAEQREESRLLPPAWIGTVPGKGLHVWVSRVFFVESPKRLLTSYNPATGGVKRLAITALLPLAPTSWIYAKTVLGAWPRNVIGSAARPGG